MDGPVVVVRAAVTGVVDADHAALGIDEWPAGVAAADARVVLDHVVERRPGELALEVRLRDDALGQREVGVAAGEAGRVHVESLVDLALVPGDVGVRSRVLEPDHREIQALGVADDLRLDLLAVILVLADPHDHRVRTARDVVVRDDETGRVDDEAGSEPSALVGVKGARLDEGALGVDAYCRILDVLEVDGWRATRSGKAETSREQGGRSADGDDARSPPTGRDGGARVSQDWLL